jgi:hypothetical protein
MMRSFALLCSLVCSAAASELAGPALGLVYDPERGLMPIRGTTGAATFGEPQPLGPDRLVIAAPAYAIVAGEDGNLRAGETTIPVPAADLAAVSPDGTAAAFYDRAGGRIRVVTGLPREAILAREIDIAGEVRKLALSDDGLAVAAAFDDRVMVFGPDSARILTAPQSASAMAFRSGSRDLLVADREAYLVREGETTLLGAVDGPVAIAASRDGNRAFLASASEVRIIEIATGAATAVPCGCEPRELAPLAGNAVFRLTDPASGAVWLLDADRDEPAVLFVPRYRAPEEEPE